MRRRSTKTTAGQRGGAAPLAYTGQLIGRDAAGSPVVTIQHDGDGWRVVVHGQGVNDEGGQYDWSRQAVDASGTPLLHDGLDAALGAAQVLVPAFTSDHKEAEATRRSDEALEAAIRSGLPPYEAYTVEQMRTEATRRGLEGFARLAKGELVALLEDDDANAKEN